MKINKTLTLFFSLMIILSLAISVNAGLDEQSEMCLKPSVIAPYLNCEDDLNNSNLCNSESTINASCDDAVICIRSLTDYCSWNNLGSCLFTGNDENGNYFYKPAYSPDFKTTDDGYPGYSDVGTSELNEACDLGCCIVEDSSNSFYAFFGEKVPRVQCEDYITSNGLSMSSGVEFKLGSCDDVNLNCGDIGDIIDTNVESCCAGFKSFDYDGLPGDTAMCYNPEIGEPECMENNTPEEGWYYNTTSDLIAHYDCDLGVHYSTCEDTDGGYNYYSFGTATDGNGDLDDNCINTTYLSETVCVLGTAQRVQYECPFGCDVNNNVCLNEVKKCSDTDNGINYFNKGTVSDSSRGACCAGLVECEYNETHNRCMTAEACGPANIVTGSAIASVSGNEITGMAAAAGDDQSFVGKIWDWFIGLFTSDEKEVNQDENIGLTVEENEEVPGLVTELYENKEDYLKKEISVGQNKVRIYSKEDVYVKSQGLDKGQYILDLEYDKVKSPTILVNVDNLVYTISETEKGSVIIIHTREENKIPDVDVEIGGIQ